MNSQSMCNNDDYFNNKKQNKPPSRKPVEIFLKEGIPIFMKLLHIPICAAGLKEQNVLFVSINNTHKYKET